MNGKKRNKSIGMIIKGLNIGALTWLAMMPFATNMIITEMTRWAISTACLMWLLFVEWCCDWRHIKGAYYGRK